MKQKTKELIEKYERAFNQGKQVMYFGKAKDKFSYADLSWYTWLPVTDVKEIKKLVLNGAEVKIS